MIWFLLHAIFIDLAIKELCRITRPGGTILIIDKFQDAFDDWKYATWIDPLELSTKQWLDEERIRAIYGENGIEDVEIADIPVAEGRLYKAFIGRKRKL